MNCRQTLSGYVKLMSLVLLMSFFANCSSKNVLSSRPLTEPPEVGEQKKVTIREIEKPTKGREFYVKERDLAIKPKRRVSDTGSLTNVGDQRSYFLPYQPPVSPGSFIDVKVTSNRLEQKPASSTNDVAPAGNANSATSTKELDDALIKALPNLEPTPESNLTPIRNMKMQVVEILENGDALVSFHRRSIREDLASDVVVKARVPYSALVDQDSLSTAQLEDVDYRESTDGEIIERRSSHWEDEYTLRMSGFDEAKSKSALVLEDQRKQLMDAKDKVTAQVKSLGKERQTMAKEREGYLADKAKSDQKITELEAKVKEQEGELEDLRPKKEEEVPSSEADKESTDKPKDDKKASAAGKAVTADKTTKAQPSKTPTATSPKPANPQRQAGANQ